MEEEQVRKISLSLNLLRKQLLEGAKPLLINHEISQIGCNCHILDLMEYIDIKDKFYIFYSLLRVQSGTYYK